MSTNASTLTMPTRRLNAKMPPKYHDGRIHRNKGRIVPKRNTYAPRW
jgi:hypothetical protein